MTDGTAHDLLEWMRQLQVDMAMHYEQIRKRSREDPGTAGDQGEADWAKLLTEWLPPTLQVVTKGRIIGPDNIVGPQIDVLVLKDIYPKGMLNRKLYLSSGVAAAFECKTTLRTHHISEAVETAGKIKQLSQRRGGSPYNELHTPIIYGLLAHSHSWVKDKSQPEKTVTSKLLEADRQFVAHPRNCLDLLCVSNLGMWASWKTTFNPPSLFATLAGYGEHGAATSSYMASTCRHNSASDSFTPIGSLLAYLSRRLAWEIPSLRQLADYYYQVSLTGGGTVHERIWTSSIYSDPVRQRVERGQMTPAGLGVWDEWSNMFYCR